jgi:hypothetical protein
VGTFDRRRRDALIGFAGAALMLLATCREDEVRPGFAPDCNDPECIDARGNIPPRSLSSSSGNGSAGAAGSGGEGNMPGAGAGTLTGTVSEVFSADLLSSRILEGTVEVRAPNETASDVVTTETGAGGMFRLDGIQQAATVWVAAGAFEDPPVEPFIDTLQAVDSERDDVVNLLVLRRDLLREVAFAAFRPSTVDFDPTAAHAILRFVQQDRTPLEGVSITFPDLTLASIAYDAGDTYSDATEVTSTRGMAVLLNMSAADYPGTQTGIVADIDGLQFSTQIQIAAGAVTVATLVIEDP